MSGLDLTERLVNLSREGTKQHKQYVAKYGKIDENTFELIFTKGAIFGMNEAQKMIEEQWGATNTNIKNELRKSIKLLIFFATSLGFLAGFALRGII